ncbi:hypothetical protein EVAR_48002_1 [Eumeta japonica]|uniref:Helitron helicase-like domain-containing protein n=1 Tax=Eumeta variegata TaxID=151549 RepID=A0A4C1XDC8_EUMVA|nr:hypothetical protein EVAR_13464_1 [Eumeta japonica]GBP60307.1 hypothetical protein EVAR_26719_1 [Eumeta japonica]GBP61669.1 hypothetical protein EVAR_43607_1 [Eumeta japonica]GBP65296.1 hypothetical protein EVAR_48002_1 [Eumeta japonica]
MRYNINHLLAGQDGYDITLKMVDPITGVSTNKNLSAMNYYAYRMMIRTHEENVILKCRRLFQQFAVDMYVKVETERLAFIRFNQAKLRSEDYIHLRDAIHSDGDVQNIGRLTILPSTYIGSPRHMHEYAQDAMTYVRNYGTRIYLLRSHAIQSGRKLNASWNRVKTARSP